MTLACLIMPEIFSWLDHYCRLLAELLTLNGAVATNFSAPSAAPDPDDPLGGMAAATVNNAFPNGVKRTHDLRLTTLGALTAARVRDILLMIDYRVAP